MITIKVSKDESPVFFERLENALSFWVEDAAAYIEGQVKTDMAEPKTGRMYGDHQASAPGESPAVDSSNLIGSIAMIFPSTLEAKVGTPVEYAAYLEHGTSRMAPRPVWERTAKGAIPTLEKMLKKAVRRR